MHRYNFSGTDPRANLPVPPFCFFHPVQLPLDLPLASRRALPARVEHGVFFPEHLHEKNTCMCLGKEKVGGIRSENVFGGKNKQTKNREIPREQDDVFWFQNFVSCSSATPLPSLLNFILESTRSPHSPLSLQSLPAPLLPSPPKYPRPMHQAVQGSSKDLALSCRRSAGVLFEAHLPLVLDS